LEKFAPYNKAIVGAQNIAWALTNANVHPEVHDHLVELGGQLDALLQAGKSEVFVLVRRVMELEAALVAEDLTPSPTITVLGVDPSLTCTGWAVLRGTSEDDCLLVAWGTKRQKSSLPEEVRGALIAAEIVAQIEEHRPDVLGVETQYAAPGRGNSSLKVAAVRGAITFAAHQYSVRVVLVQPATAKLAIAGNGHASHQEVQQAAHDRFQEKLPQDAAYAVAMALVAMADELKLRLRGGL